MSKQSIEGKIALTRQSSLLITILNYLVISVVFAGAFIYKPSDNIELRLSYLIMLVTLLFWFPVLRDLVFNKVFFLPFSLILLTSFYNIVIGNNSVFLFLKQALGIGINALWFYLFLKINDFDVKKIFRIYLNIAFLVALIGIFQQISYLIGFCPGYDYSWFLPFWIPHPAGNFLRVNSILPEPAGFCVSLAPALFVSLCSAVDNKFAVLNKAKSFLIIAAFLLSFSSVGYLGLVISLILISFSYRKLTKILLFFTLIGVFLVSAFFVSIDFKNRVKDSLEVLRAKADIATVNLSVYALYSNILVVKEAFFEKPLIGFGLGSHELNYDKYFNKVIKIRKPRERVNVHDAGSLALRLLSETGILGFGLFIWFLLKFYLRRDVGRNDVFWAINSGLLLFFILRLIRVGHYFTDGFFFFFWLYYATKELLPQKLEKP